MKNTLNLLTITTCLLCTLTARAQLPEYYNEVHHVIWVVDDLEEVRTGWKSLGFSDLNDLGTLTITENGSRMSTALACCMHMGGARVLWIEPVKGKSIFTKFHKDYGDGVFSLVHEPGSTFEFERELARLKSAGLKNPVRVHVHGPRCDIMYAFAGTLSEGKYELGLVEEAASAYFHENPAEVVGPGMVFSQYAFAIKDPEVVSGFWESLEFPAMDITSTDNHDKIYMGEPADYGMNLGWQRHGRIVYEWCVPIKSPNVYEDHIKKHGEGFQHFAFKVPDIDVAIAYMESKGLSVSQSGGWGEKGQPGSGRYAYIDATPWGGVSIELLWNRP